MPRLMHLLVFTIAVSIILCGSVCTADILIYDHNTDNGHSVQAATNLGLAFTQAGQGNFNTLLTGQSWDLVVMDVPGVQPAGGYGDLINYVDGGGKAIMSFWTLQTEPSLAAAFDVAQVATFSTPQDVFAWDAGHPVFNDPNSVSGVMNWTDSWLDNGDRLDPINGAVALAGFTGTPTPGLAAIVLGNDGATIYNGFLIDDATNPVGTQLMENQIQYLLSPQAVPEPLSLAAWSVVALGLAGYGARRRRAAVAA